MASTPRRSRLQVLCRLTLTSFLCHLSLFSDALRWENVQNNQKNVLFFRLFAPKFVEPCMETSL